MHTSKYQHTATTHHVGSRALDYPSHKTLKTRLSVTTRPSAITVISI